MSQAFEADVLKILNCVVYEHDLRLVAISALICALGCFTTTTLMARSRTAAGSAPQWLACAALLFGSSVWSLHFVAMLAFMPGTKMAYDMGLTAISLLVSSGGALAAFLIWRARLPRLSRVVLGGISLGVAISGMHYLGVAAMSFSGFVLLDPGYMGASVAISVVFSAVALFRAEALRTALRRAEVAAWLALAICGLHFTGMAAMTIAPGEAVTTGDAVLGTATLAIVVGSVSLAILIASLAATMVEQHLSQRAMQDLDRMRLLSNLAQEVLFIHRDGIVFEVNSAGERLFKTKAGDIIGHPLLEFFTDESRPALSRRAQCPPMERRSEEMEARAIDGTRVPVEISCQAIDYLGKPATAIALRDLTNAKRDEARIQHLARHDALTNLPNRYNLQERLDIALNAAAHDRSPLALVYIDLDRFKPVNDLYGHAAGDALLIQVSKRILAEIQAKDSLARVGGDEFVMILTGAPQPQEASDVGMRVIAALQKPFQVEGHGVEIGASIGVALYPNDGGNADDLMRAADAAMYRAKEDGRGTLRFYEASMNSRHRARLQLEQELSGAIPRGELKLHYQPILDTATGEVEAVEALLRWDHPTRGMAPPSEFIPLAEETGLIHSIGKWVIETACREAARWERPWRVAVNVSPKQFGQSDICGVIGNALRANGLDPDRLVVEITETVLMADTAKALAILNRLRDMGVRIALDDFGTGYSSLSYLQLFKFDKFKIDKSFVQKLGQSEEAATIARTIVTLGHNLGLQVTAEGVETPAQLKVLQMLGCDQIQGYLVAKPAPMDAFTPLDQLRAAALIGRDLRLSA